MPQDKILAWRPRLSLVIQPLNSPLGSHAQEKPIQGSQASQETAEEWLW